MGTWVPHELSDKNKTDRLSICTSLLSRQINEPFLDRIITGDEKWVLYVNFVRKRQWVDKDKKPEPDPKPELHQKKVMLCIWWDRRGVVWFELLKNNQTITAEVYSQQLQRLHDELVKKRPALVNRKGVILLHDNARPHVAKITQKKILELGWSVLPHPPYSPDIAPSDFHLFLSLQNNLGGMRFKNDNEVESELIKFFSSCPPDFYSRGIDKLPGRWEKVIENGGDYFVE